MNKEMRAKFSSNCHYRKTDDRTLCPICNPKSDPTAPANLTAKIVRPRRQKSDSPPPQMFRDARLRHVTMVSWSTDY